MEFCTFWWIHSYLLISALCKLTWYIFVPLHLLLFTSLSLSLHPSVFLNLLIYLFSCVDISWSQFCANWLDTFSPIYVFISLSISLFIFSYLSHQLPFHLTFHLFIHLSFHLTSLQIRLDTFLYPFHLTLHLPITWTLFNSLSLCQFISRGSYFFLKKIPWLFQNFWSNFPWLFRYLLKF